MAYLGRFSQAQVGHFCQAPKSRRLAHQLMPASTTLPEHHFTAKQVAEEWNLSQDTIYRLFLNEPGVLIIASERKKYRRTRRTLRIPESVKNRVYRRLQNVAR